MTASDPFNANPEISAMKQNVADRIFKLKMVEGVINLAAVGLAIAGAFMVASSGGALAPAVVPIALAVGGGLASFVTMKARKKLEIDEEYLQSRMQGKNWWGGYREEVAEQGYAQPSAPVLGGTPGRPQSRSK